VYVNSLLNIAIALNQRSFAALHKIQSGPGWSIEIAKN
jgi:S-adenosylmethionine hydrolase